MIWQKKHIVFIIALLVLAVSTADAGNVGRIGTSAAQELRIPVGSRGTALGGAILANVQGIESLYWNPAGLVVGDHNHEAMFTYLDYMADMQMNYFGISSRLREDISIGIAVKVFSVGDIIVTTELSPEGTGEILTPKFSTVALTYSQKLTDRLNFGTTIKFIHEAIKRETAQGLAFDFGFQYRTGLRGLTLAVTMRNFGTDISFDGPDLERSIKLSDAVPEADPQSRTRNFRTTLSPAELPTSVELGLAYELFQSPMGKAIFSATFRNNNLASDEYQAGIEYDFFQSMFQLRGGYIASPTGGTQPSGFKKQFILGPTAGFGLNVPMGEDFRFKVDYAYGATEFFQDNHWLTVGFGF